MRACFIRNCLIRYSLPREPWTHGWRCDIILFYSACFASASTHVCHISTATCSLSAHGDAWTPLLSKQVLASATRLSKSRQAQACRASERCRRREPDLAQGAAQDTVAISQPSAAPPFDPASFHATNFTRAQSAQRAHSPLQRQRVRDLVPCTRVLGFPSFALQSPSNASRRGVFHLKLASRHARGLQLVVGLFCARRLVVLCVLEAEIGAREAPGAQKRGGA